MFILRVLLEEAHGQCHNLRLNILTGDLLASSA